MCKFLLQKDICHCMGPVLDIHLFRIKLNLAGILLYLAFYIPVLKLGYEH